jgi:hypothetical protein
MPDLRKRPTQGTCATSGKRYPVHSWRGFSDTHKRRLHEGSPIPTNGLQGPLHEECLTRCCLRFWPRQEDFQTGKLWNACWFEQDPNPKVSGYQPPSTPSPRKPGLTLKAYPPCYDGVDQRLCCLEPKGRDNRGRAGRVYIYQGHSKGSSLQRGEKKKVTAPRFKNLGDQ